MKHAAVFSAVAVALALSACERPKDVVVTPGPTVAVPVPGPTVAVPGPQGAPGPSGAPGAPGAQGEKGEKGRGDTVVIVPPPAKSN